MKPNEIDTDIKAAVVTDDEAEALWFAGDLVVVRMPGERTGDQFMLVEATGQRGSAPPWHRHPYDDETFHILEGEITIWCGDPTSPVLRGRSGDTAFLPRRVPHTFRVDSETARWLVMGTPAVSERFFREGGEPAPSRTGRPVPPDMNKIMAAHERFEMEVLGPRPTLDSDRIM